MGVRFRKGRPEINPQTGLKNKLWTAELNTVPNPKTGKKPWRQQFFTEEEATQGLLEMYQFYGLTPPGAAPPKPEGNPSSPYSLSAVVEHCQRLVWSKRRSDDSYDRAMIIIKDLGPGRDVRRITEEMLEAYLTDVVANKEGRRGQKISPNTQKKYKSTLQVMWRIAKKQKLVPRSFTLDVVLQKEKFERHVFLDDEPWKERFIEVFNSEADRRGDLHYKVCADIFEFMATTGARIGEVVGIDRKRGTEGIRYENCNLHRMSGTFTRTKNGKKRQFGFPRAMFEKIGRWRDYGAQYGKGGSYKDHVFPSTTDAFRDRFMVVRDIVCREFGWSPAEIETFTPHSLRHQVACEIYGDSDISTNDALDYLGHDYLETANRYRHSNGKNNVRLMQR